VCEYAGRLISDREADDVRADDDDDEHDTHGSSEAGRGSINKHDDYFFGLDHYFFILEKGLGDSVEGLTYGGEDLRQLRERLDHAPVIDAKAAGNVGRFINHSSSESGAQSINLLIQPVFTSPMHSLQFYRVAFFASRDIEPYEELFYNYGYDYGNEEVWPAWYRHGGNGVSQPAGSGSTAEAQDIEEGATTALAVNPHITSVSKEETIRTPKINALGGKEVVLTSFADCENVIDLTFDDDDE
jgi:hypothetical protein